MFLDASIQMLLYLAGDGGFQVLPDFWHGLPEQPVATRLLIERAREKPEPDHRLVANQNSFERHTTSGFIFSVSSAERH